LHGANIATTMRKPPSQTREVNLALAARGVRRPGASFVAGCPSACKLYAQYVTDATTWPLVALPSGDNPGTQLVINGEVKLDPEDTMGPGDIPGDWTSPQFHAGSWQWWQNKSQGPASLPYCNYDMSPINATGQSYHFQNNGPLPFGERC
jgi:hypothetical protein